jgi:hypothetical protein
VTLSNRAGQYVFNAPIALGGQLAMRSNRTIAETMFATGGPVVSNRRTSVLKRPIFTVDVPVTTDGEIVNALLEFYYLCCQSDAQDADASAHRRPRPAVSAVAS